MRPKNPRLNPLPHNLQGWTVHSRRSIPPSVVAAASLRPDKWDKSFEDLTAARRGPGGGHNKNKGGAVPFQFESNPAEFVHVCRTHDPLGAV